MTLGGAELIGTDRRRRRRGWVPVVAAVVALSALLALLLFGLFARAPNTTIDDGLARAKFVKPPPFTLPVLAARRLPPGLASRWRAAAADGTVALRELRGTPVVVNFWASWCDPCRREAPVLERAWRRYGPKSVLFLGLNQQDAASDARAFLGRYSVGYPNLKEAGDATSGRWGLTGYPETFFVSRRGAVVAHVIGVVTAQRLAVGIKAAESEHVLGADRGGGQGAR